MTAIHCRAKECMSNKHGQCLANTVQLDKEYKCKTYVCYVGLVGRAVVLKRSHGRLKRKGSEKV